MPFDVDALLPLAECLKPRAPKELREWVLAKCDAFRQIPELREPVLRHEGPFKWFHEEIYPLSVFAVRRYGDRDDVLCVPKGGPTRDVDAEVVSRRERSASRSPAPATRASTCGWNTWWSTAA